MYKSIKEYLEAVKTNKEADTQKIQITQEILKREIIIYLVEFDKNEPHVTKAALNVYNDKTTTNLSTTYLVRMEGYYNLLTTAALYDQRIKYYLQDQIKKCNDEMLSYKLLLSEKEKPSEVDKENLKRKKESLEAF